METFQPLVDGVLRVLFAAVLTVLPGSLFWLAVLGIYSILRRIFQFFGAPWQMRHE